MRNKPLPAVPAIDESSARKLLYFMRSVGRKVLKNKLSEYVRLAASGEVVLVTDRDRVVAELIPPREGRSEMLNDAKLADAVRNGLLTPPLMVSAEPPGRAPIARLDSLLRELDESRADR